LADEDVGFAEDARHRIALRRQLVHELHLADDEHLGAVGALAIAGRNAPGESGEQAKAERERGMTHMRSLGGGGRRPNDGWGRQAAIGRRRGYESDARTAAFGTARDLEMERSSSVSAEAHSGVVTQRTRRPRSPFLSLAVDHAHAPCEAACPFSPSDCVLL